MNETSLSEENSLNFALRITRTVFDFWKSDFAFWQDAIKVFYTSVVKNPPLLIVTLNPGGGARNYEKEDKDRFEIHHDFSPPSENEYITKRDWAISQTLRRFFRENLELLEHSVGIPVIFFRSSDFKQLRKAASDDRALFTRCQRNSAVCRA